MKQKLIVRYISIIFVIATFMSGFHHHNDLQKHTDCQICTIQNSLTDIDTPTGVNYVTSLCIESQETLTELKNFQLQQKHLTFSARAPPLFS